LGVVDIVAILCERMLVRVVSSKRKCRITNENILRLIAWLLYSEAPASFAGWIKKVGNPLNLFQAFVMPMT